MRMAAEKTKKQHIQPINPANLIVSIVRLDGFFTLKSKQRRLAMGLGRLGFTNETHFCALLSRQTHRAPGERGQWNRGPPGEPAQSSKRFLSTHVESMRSAVQLCVQLLRFRVRGIICGPNHPDVKGGVGWVGGMGIV